MVLNYPFLYKLLPERDAELDKLQPPLLGIPPSIQVPKRQPAVDQSAPLGILLRVNCIIDLPFIP
ncbi:MAG: hypothetical protein L0Y68_03080 [Candidatus Dadabacteria bacterium]|nr:hypothetical protein [Candidatus Dadabacteria bacterium]